MEESLFGLAALSLPEVVGLPAARMGSKFKALMEDAVPEFSGLPAWAAIAGSCHLEIWLAVSRALWVSVRSDRSSSGASLADGADGCEAEAVESG